MKPDKEESKAGIFTYSWNGTHQISIRIDRIKEKSGKVDCEMSVRSKDRVVYHSGLNLLAHRSRVDAGNSLAQYRAFKDDMNWKEFPWSDVVQYACTRTLQLFRQGDPPIRLGNQPIEKVKHLMFPLLVQDQANMIYAPGESSKSLLSMFLGCVVQSGELMAGLRPTAKKNVLYLDYETSPSEFNSRVMRLKKGNSFDDKLDILYRWSFQPLNNELETLQAIIEENKIGFIIVDSFTKASDGDTNEAQTAAKFYRTLRELGGTSLVLDHVNKQHIQNGGTYGPMGSIVKVNDARNIFEIKADIDDETDSIEIMLKHIKFNNGRKVKPFGMKFNFFEDGITVEKTDVAKNTVLNKSLSLKDQINNVLNGKTMTAQDIASEIDANPGSVTTTLNRYKDIMFVRVMDSWGRKARD